MQSRRIYSMQDAQSVAADGIGDVIVLSPPFAPRSMGIGFWQEILRALDGNVTAVLDCGDRTGDVMDAISAKIPHILYSGDAKTLEKLRQLARLAGVELYADIAEISK